MEIEPRTDKETELIEQLRNAIDDLHLPKDCLEDKNLVRWLRARNQKLKETEQMIRKNVEWRREFEIESVWEDGNFPKEFLTEFPYPIVGFDFQGNPVAVCSVEFWDVQKAMAEGKKNEFMRYLAFISEKALVLSKKQAETESLDFIPQCVNIFNFQGLGLRQVTSPEVIDVVLKYASVFEANYPETMKCSIILNAPWAFQIIWKILRPFLTERTHSKFIFLGSDVQEWRERISKIVPLDQFPKDFGGNADDSVYIEVKKDGSWNRSWNNENNKTEQNLKNN